MRKISIALATYNGHRYIDAQLKSIANQTVIPSELVVADDGSSDGTKTIIREFAKNASFPVRVIHNTARLGYRRNFMQAAAACTSDLIAFCDQDDIWDHDKLNVMREAFSDPNVLLAYHNATLIDESGAAIGTTFHKRKATTFDPLTMYPWHIIPGLVQMVRRSLLRLTSLHGGSTDPYAPHHPMPHDQWYPFWASVLGRVVYIPDRLAQYRQHGANESGWPAHYIAYAVDHIRNAELYVGGNAIGAKNRLELLLQCHNLLRSDEKAHIDAAIQYYQALTADSDQRLAIYQEKSLASRTRALVALLKQRVYRGRRSDALGLDALLLDACIGIPFKRLGRMR